MKLLLVDGSALLHRAYHAYPSLTTRSGEVVGAVYGVVSMLLAALEEVKPDQVVVAWDLPQPTFRHEKYVAYKAQRVKADEEMVEQIPTVKHLIESMGLVQIGAKGYEADDIIGTLAGKYKGEVDILSGDMDLTQLVNERIRMIAPARGKQPAMVYGPREVRDKLGVEPWQVVDYKALVGDASDNIPGVAGIGPVTAAKLLNQYKSLQGIYAALNDEAKATKFELGTQIAEKLRAGKDSAFLSQELARIECKMDLEVKDETAYSGLVREEFRKELEKLNFRSLIKRVFGAEEKKAEKSDNQMGLF